MKIGLEFPDPDNDPMIAIDNGYEIQIDDLATPDGDPIYQTGSIYGFAAPRQIASKEVGQWNTFEIKVIYESYLLL